MDPTSPPPGRFSVDEAGGPPIRHSGASRGGRGTEPEREEGTVTLTEPPTFVVHSSHAHVHRGGMDSTVLSEGLGSAREPADLVASLVVSAGELLEEEALREGEGVVRDATELDATEEA